MHVSVQRQGIDQIVRVPVRQLHLQHINAWVQIPLNTVMCSW